MKNILCGLICGAFRGFGWTRDSTCSIKCSPFGLINSRWPAGVIMFPLCWVKSKVYRVLTSVFLPGKGRGQAGYGEAAGLFAEVPGLLAPHPTSPLAPGKNSLWPTQICSKGNRHPSSGYGSYQQPGYGCPAPSPPTSFASLSPYQVAQPVSQPLHRTRMVGTAFQPPKQPLLLHQTAASTSQNSGLLLFYVYSAGPSRDNSFYFLETCDGQSESCW